MPNDSQTSRPTTTPISEVTNSSVITVFRPRTSEYVFEHADEYVLENDGALTVVVSLGNHATFAAGEWTHVTKVIPVAVASQKPTD